MKRSRERVAERQKSTSVTMELSKFGKRGSRDGGENNREERLRGGEDPEQMIRMLQLQVLTR